MHPATATTPFTLLWALEKNEEDPPFWSLAASSRAQSQQPNCAPTPTATVRAATLSADTTREHANARPESATANGDNHDCPTTSDFLVTNLRPDLLD